MITGRYEDIKTWRWNCMIISGLIIFLTIAAAASSGHQVSK
jgi:hypothetical protein